MVQVALSSNARAFAILAFALPHFRTSTLSTLLVHFRLPDELELMTEVTANAREV